MSESGGFLQSVSNFSFGDLIDYDCPVYGNNSDFIIEQATFWIEGVALTAVATFGVLGNILASIILSRPELRNSFNLLLVGLALFDTCYILGSILETVRKSFRAASQLHLFLFPYLLFPGQMIALTGSVFMIVAIAFERYVSVHRPLDYNQAMNDPDGIKRRLLKFLVPVILLSVIINIPKFFETEAVFHPLNENQTEASLFFPEYEIGLNFTQMRVHPVYSSYVNWSQLFFLGIIPVCLLVYFNTKIYQDIRERERRRRRPTFGAINNEASAPNVVQGAQIRQSWESQGRKVISRLYQCFTDCTTRFKLTQNLSESESQTGSTSGLNPCESQISRGARTSVEVTNLQTETNGMSNAKRRKVEDRLALLFMGIVAFFLVCHFPRILLNFYEMLVIEQAMECNRNGKRAFAVWAQIMTSVSHFLLVLNSSINILIYSLFNTQFRTATKHFWKETVCRRGNNGVTWENASPRRRSMGQTATTTRPLSNSSHLRNKVTVKVELEPFLACTPQEKVSETCVIIQSELHSQEATRSSMAMSTRV